MQTTLRLNDDVYRRAKARVAEVGVTLTRFIEEALAERLLRPEVRPLPPLPVHDSGEILPDSFDLLAAVAEAEGEYQKAEATKVVSPGREP